MLTLDLDGLLIEVSKHNASVLGVQLPSGLRQRSREVLHFFNRHDYDVIFSGDQSYGACDIADEPLADAGADIMVHFGHSKMLPSTRIPVIYWHVKDDIDIVPAISGNLERIRKAGKRVGLATTIQHVHGLEEVSSFLVSKGFDVSIGKPVDRVSYPGQVLGCSFEAIGSIDVDFYIYVGTGKFHPIGMSLATDKEVLHCDPYMGTCESIIPERDMILKKRYAMMEKARHKTDFGMLLSTKKGQYRHDEALEIKSLLNEHGKNCVLILAEEINKYIIQDFDMEAFVVAACPRIAIDDAIQFDKPVLTITEARMLFEEMDYRFDEIK